MASDAERIETALGKITITGDLTGIRIDMAAAKNELVRTLEETQKESSEWRRLYHNSEALLATFRQAVGMAFTIPGATHLQVDTIDPIRGMKHIIAAVSAQAKSMLDTMNVHARNASEQRQLKLQAEADIKRLEETLKKLQETDAKAIREQERIINDLRQKLDEVGADNYRLRGTPVKTAQHIAWELGEKLRKLQDQYHGDYQLLMAAIDDANKRAREEK